MGPYYSTSQAAEYCGYSLKTFKKYVKEYPLPRKGPGNNRYAKSDLDMWMESPASFLPSRQNKNIIPNFALQY